MQKSLRNYIWKKYMCKYGVRHVAQRQREFIAGMPDPEITNWNRNTSRLYASKDAIEKRQLPTENAMNR